MLKPIPYCECGKVATRFVPDRHPHRGRLLMLALCPHCPTPDEIDARAAKVREAWSDQEHYCKHYGVNRNSLEYIMAVTFPQCRPINLTGRVDRTEVLPG